MGKKFLLTDRISRRHTLIEDGGYGSGPESLSYEQSVINKEQAARAEEIQAGSWEDLYRVDNERQEDRRHAHTGRNMGENGDSCTDYC